MKATPCSDYPKQRTLEGIRVEVHRTNGGLYWWQVLRSPYREGDVIAVIDGPPVHEENDAWAAAERAAGWRSRGW